MKLRRTAKRLVSAKKSVDFMTLMKEAVRRAKRHDRLNEKYGCSEDEEEDVDTEAGLDELEGTEDELPADEDLDFDDADLEGDEDRPTVTITIPVDATIEEIQDAIDDAEEGEGSAELDAAAEDAVDDIEAEAAADEEFGEESATEDEDLPEEDEEAFAATYNEAPVRKQAQTTWNNDLTVKSNISATVGEGKPAVYTNGAATRTKAQTTWNNDMTVKSAIQPGVSWQR